MNSEYIYIGAVADRYNNILIRDGQFYTVTGSFQEVRRNILSQAKRRLGLKQSAFLKLTRPDDIEMLVETDIQYCPECGTQLTDGGYCPNCYTEGDETNYL